MCASRGCVTSVCVCVCTCKHSNWSYPPDVVLSLAAHWTPEQLQSALDSLQPVVSVAFGGLADVSDLLVGDTHTHTHTHGRTDTHTHTHTNTQTYMHTCAGARGHADACLCTHRVHGKFTGCIPGHVRPCGMYLCVYAGCVCAPCRAPLTARQA